MVDVECSLSLFNPPSLPYGGGGGGKKKKMLNCPLLAAAATTATGRGGGGVKKKGKKVPPTTFWTHPKNFLRHSRNLFKFVSVLLSALVDRVGVSRMRFF